MRGCMLALYECGIEASDCCYSAVPISYVLYFVFCVAASQAIYPNKRDFRGDFQLTGYVENKDSVLKISPICLGMELMCAQTAETKFYVSAQLVRG